MNGSGVGRLAALTLLGIAMTTFSPPARAEDRLPSEELDFSGTIAFLGMGVPGFVLAAVRGD